jgi:hypothetical protein
MGKRWENAMWMALFNKADRLSPERRKEVFEKHYCTKCWQQLVYCQCDIEGNEDEE